MKRLSLILIFVFIASLCFGFRDKEPPGWVVSKGKNTAYPEDQYFIGFGISGNKGDVKEKRDQAEKSAKNIIIETIKNKINRQMIDSWLESEGYTKEKMNNDLYNILIDNIHKYVDYDYEGIVIDSVYYDKSKEIFYIMAFMNRQSVSLDLKKNITRLNFEAEMSYRNAVKYFDTGSYFYALQNLFNSEEKKFRSILFGLKYIAVRTDQEKTAGLNKMSFYLKDLEKTISTTVEGFTIELKTQAKLDFSEKIRDLPIELYFYFRSPNNTRIPIKDAKIIPEFKAGTGEMFPDFSNSDQGLYKFKIKSIEKDKTNSAMIVFKPDISILEKSFTNSLTKYWLSRLNEKKINFEVNF